jgi:hypothetical protein
VAPSAIIRKITYDPCLNQQNHSQITNMSDHRLQMNIRYLPTQDRLLLRASNQKEGEFRVWLTRRYTALLVKILYELMEKAGGIQEIASDPATVSHFKQGAFDQDYDPPTEANETRATPLPLGEQGILGHTLQYEQRANAIATVKLLPEQGQGLHLTLNRTLLYMLYNLLEQAIASADWNIKLHSSHKETVH